MKTKRIEYRLVLQRLDDGQPTRKRVLRLFRWTRKVKS